MAKREAKTGVFMNMMKHLKQMSSDFKEICSSQRILDSSTNILHFFVNDLLDFAQLQSNNFKKTLEVFDVKEAVQELIQM
jgi:K+-sensing histidine kinase KdpD